MTNIHQAAYHMHQLAKSWSQKNRESWELLEQILEECAPYRRAQIFLKGVFIRKIVSSLTSRLPTLFDRSGQDLLEEILLHLIIPKHLQFDVATPISPHFLHTMQYSDYLHTDHWQRMRYIALFLADKRCQVCNSSNNLEVHHRTYERRGYEQPNDLTVLCRRCHQIFTEHGVSWPTPN